MTVTGVSAGGEPKNREDITVGHTEVPIKVYRTNGFPMIFAGFQTSFFEDAHDPETGTTFDMGTGAGLGSPYLTIRVEVPGHPTVYEYVDVRELLTQRVETIIEELTSKEQE